jgi:threonine/homoserine/homoserine lactone efflux protein
MIREVLIEGILLGFTLTIMVGPVFFAHLQTALNRGFWASNYLLIGIVINDVLLIFLSFLGTAQLMEHNNNKLIIGIGGGLILIVFGFISFRKKVRISDMRPKVQALTTGGVLHYILKGFLLNVLNPFVWIFWIGVVTLLSSNYVDHEYPLPYILTFFSLVLGIYFVLNIVKGALSYKVKRLIKPKTIVWMNKVVGILLFVFGIVLIVRVIYESIA